METTGRRKRGSRLNNWIKFFVLQSTSVFSMVGWSIIGLSIFILVSDWGDLDKDFFVGWGVVGVFFGAFLFLTSTVGYLGVRFQIHKSTPTSPLRWTGRRILGLYLLILTGALIAELWMVVKLAASVKSLETTRDVLQKDSNSVILYDSLEQNLAVRFNDFYFGAVSGCQDVKYHWFWLWVDNHCSSSMDSTNCQICGDFSVSTCDADAATCYNSVDDAGPTCPYEICRLNTIKYVIRRVKPVYLYILIFAAFHIGLIIFSCAAMCYTEQDSTKRILEKSGTIPAKGDARATSKPKEKTVAKTALNLLEDDDSPSPAAAKDDKRVTSPPRDIETGREKKNRDDSASKERHRDPSREKKDGDRDTSREKKREHRDDSASKEHHRDPSREKKDGVRDVSREKKREHRDDSASKEHHRDASREKKRDDSSGRHRETELTAAGTTPLNRR